MRYVKYGEEWYKIEETYTDPEALDIYANINKVLDILNYIQSTYSILGMESINISQKQKIHEAMRKLGALLSLPMEVPTLVPNIKEYTITVRVSGDYDDDVPTSIYKTEEEQKEPFNDLISDDNFGMLEDINWDKEKIIRLYQNKDTMFMSVPVTGKFTFTIHRPNLTFDELQEIGLKHFETADFGALINADIESIVLDSEK